MFRPRFIINAKTLMIEHKFSGKIDNIGEKNHYIYFHQL